MKVSPTLRSDARSALHVRALTVGVLVWVAVACGSSPADPQVSDPDPDPQPGDSAVWTMVWQDEFDGSALDLSKWTPQTGDGCDIGICDWGNNELQWYQEANAVVGNGVLSITARQESAGGKAYTSARLRTAGKGDWRYARVEARARLPLGQGMWPAIWMLPTDEVYGVWAASGEIDIMELVGHEPSTVHGTLHYGGAWPNNRSSGSSYRLASGTFADDFHVFAIEWEEGIIRWYVDGELYQTQRSWSTSVASYPAPFDERFHLLVNLAVGGDWPGSPDATTEFPQTLTIDWIRVYQKR